MTSHSLCSRNVGREQSYNTAVLLNPYSRGPHPSYIDEHYSGCTQHKHKMSAGSSKNQTVYKYVKEH